MWEQEEAYWRFLKMHDQEAFLKLWDGRSGGRMPTKMEEETG